MFNEILKSLKSGSPVEKLNITSDILTIITAVIALITSQIFTLKFAIDQITFIILSFYLIAMGFSLLAFYGYLRWLVFVNHFYKSLIVRLAFWLFATATFIAVLAILWTYIISLASR